MNDSSPCTRRRMHARFVATIPLMLSACLPFSMPDLDSFGSTTGPALDLGTPPRWWTDVGVADDGGSTSSNPATGPGGSGPGDDPTPPPRLRLTEVLPDPQGTDGAADSPELIEIQNVGDDAASLARLVVRARSWPVLDAAKLGLSELRLLPGELLVLERYTDAASVHPSQARDGVILVSFASSGGLRNGDGGIRLEDVQGTVLDVLQYGLPQGPPYADETAWQGDPAPTPPSGRSLCRPDPTLDHDDATDWTDCTPSPGTLPTNRPPPPPPNAELVIMEVLSNPPGPSTEEKAYEFVEVLNLGPDAIDLADLTIADAAGRDAVGIDPLSFAGGDGGCRPSTCLAPGRRAILVGNAYVGPTGDALVMETDDTTLANAGLATAEPVVLRDRSGKIVSSYRLWRDPMADPLPSTIERAIVRIDPRAPDEPLSWTFADPTPGE